MGETMIQFALKCAEGHRFESWFQTGAAYDKLARAGLVVCAVCGSHEVTKDVMAPRVAPKKEKSTALAAPQSEAERALARLRKHVEETSDYVGRGFAAEARAIHDGAAPERAIHGEARPEEARALIEDGIPVAPLPFVPKPKTN
jgi:hypothetical protein